MSVLLSIEGVSVAYGASVVLADVDIAVPEGCIVGVLGANGAGKSTLLRTVAGLVRPAVGTIKLRGHRIDKLHAHDIARRGVCLIPEGRGILPALSVNDNLRVSVRSEGGTDRVLDRFPVLGERLDQAAGTLSGGEQQMLALSRALGDLPDLLLIDEPSLGLAPRVVSVIERTLEDLHDRGGTIVWVEQYASHVMALADVIYILSRGKVVWAGEPAELRASPVLTRTYLGSTG